MRAKQSPSCVRHLTIMCIEMMCTSGPVPGMGDWHQREYYSFEVSVPDEYETGMGRWRTASMTRKSDKNAASHS